MSWETLLTAACIGVGLAGLEPELKKFFRLRWRDEMRKREIAFENTGKVNFDNAVQQAVEQVATIWKLRELAKKGADWR